MTHRFRTPLPRLLLAAGVAAVLAVDAAFLTASGDHGRPAGEGVASPASGRAAASVATTPVATATARPNIVFVLTDDLSMDLLRYMPAVHALASRGMTFANYFVSDSLCCPSRASIFTGDFPHDSRVFTNNGRHGGMAAWIGHGDELQTFNVALQHAGYRTAMMGKYINGYLEGRTRSPVDSRYIPPGWNEWDVAGWGYPGFDYEMNINGTVHLFGHRPRVYLTSVLTRRGVRFIDRAARSKQPFFLELATFSPTTPTRPRPATPRGSRTSRRPGGPALISCRPIRRGGWPITLR